VRYLNNVAEQDHRSIKRRVRAMQGFAHFTPRKWHSSPVVWALEDGLTAQTWEPPHTRIFSLQQGPLRNAAYSRTRQLRLYRWRELTDEAVRANLVERAVYAASRARAVDSVEDPKRRYALPSLG
jgi:hypothetical protein